jgi:MFS family permease
MSRNKGLKILFSISVLMTFILAIFAPFYALYIINLGGSPELAGISWAIFSIVSGIFMLFIRNWQSTVTHKKNLYAFGYMLISITFLLYFFITSIYVLFLAQIIFGIAMAFVNPAFDTLFSKHTKKGKKFLIGVHGKELPQSQLVSQQLSEVSLFKTTDICLYLQLCLL